MLDNLCIVEYNCVCKVFLLYIKGVNMQIEEHNNLVELYDTYGKLLSQKQREVMAEVLNSDYTESEIAEIRGETRQSVHDAITKAVQQLRKYEERCKVIANSKNCKLRLQAVKKLIALGEEEDARSMIDDIMGMF